MTFLGNEVKIHGEIFDCLIVGSGAAAYNAAVHLWEKGIHNIALVTEDREAGTSRNTGSDKQTYYKIACAGDQKDSPEAMAETLFAGGSMDGDIALCEASHSLQEFFHLVSIGVEFPHNQYGEFAGYKTDHDPLQRASSIGPYTSKMMTIQLEKAVLLRDIQVIDKTRVIKILADRENNRAYGLLCMKGNDDFPVYFGKNIIFASGGPCGLYRNTVYPQSQFGSSGILAREGVVFSNITEWQYGIGSTKFRWNLSGSYQQVIPRYVSIDESGHEEEFLSAYFRTPQSMGLAVFLKGYQWPFDPGKLTSPERSSMVDLAVFIEKHIRGRKVFLDYTRNPAGFSLDEMDKTARDYLEKSDALRSSPLERLLRLNPLSYDLYKSNGIDLAKENLEIDVLPQHHNGGAEVNIWWETSVKHLFAIGECAGTHGIHRPGGSALNSGQVGGYRAASFIAGRYAKDEAEGAFYGADTLKAMAYGTIGDFEKDLAGVPSAHAVSSGSVPSGDLLRGLQKMNTRNAMFIRCGKEIVKSLEIIKNLSQRKLRSGDDIYTFLRFREMLLLSRLLYDGILSYLNSGGKSRGSWLAVDSPESVTGNLSSIEIDILHRDKVLNTSYNPVDDSVVSSFRQVRPIPQSDTWFENVWREYRNFFMPG